LELKGREIESRQGIGRVVALKNLPRPFAVSLENGGFFKEIKFSMEMSPGANPTTLINNASDVKNYNAMSSLVDFDNKNMFFNTTTRSSVLQRWRCS
jgi:hypothetical protein